MSRWNRMREITEATLRALVGQADAPLTLQVISDALVKTFPDATESEVREALIRLAAQGLIQFGTAGTVHFRRKKYEELQSLRAERDAVHTTTASAELCHAGDQVGD